MATPTEKPLGQLEPADTNAASLYSPGAAITRTIVRQIVVCNTDSSARTYRIYYDNDGSTYSTATALFYDVSLAANTTDVINCFIIMDDSSGNLAVRSSSASTLTFTAFGIEFQ